MTAMKSVIGMMGCFVMLCGTALATGPSGPAVKASLADAKGENVGEATLEEVMGRIKIQLKVSKLPPGVHAFHIHAAGSCEGPDFKSASGHFNPYGRKHGHKNPEGAHAGDLPNITVGADGMGTAEVVATGVTLGPGENSLFHQGGRPW